MTIETVQVRWKHDPETGEIVGAEVLEGAHPWSPRRDVSRAALESMLSRGDLTDALLEAAGYYRAGWRRALLRARRYLHSLRIADATIEAMADRERFTADHLARVGIMETADGPGLPQLVGRVVDQLINAGHAADLAERVAAEECKARERAEAREADYRARWAATSLEAGRALGRAQRAEERIRGLERALEAAAGEADRQGRRVEDLEAELERSTEDEDLNI
jgi:hypothetical protein